MNAARWRISGMGELEYGWKRSSSVRTRFPGAAGASSFPKPNALAACAKAEDGLVLAGDFGRLKLFPRGLAGFPECIVLVIEGTCRGAVRLEVERAHRRHMVLSAARAADSIGGAIVDVLCSPEVYPSESSPERTVEDQYQCCFAGKCRVQQ